MSRNTTQGHKPSGRPDGGQWTEARHPRPTPAGPTDWYRVLPTVDPAEWEPERVWERVETLTGERLRLLIDRDGKPPVLLDTDDIRRGHAKLVAYADKHFDRNLSDEEVATLMGRALLTGDEAVEASRMAGSFKPKPGTRFIVLEGEGTEGPHLVAITGGFTKTGKWLYGGFAGRPVTVENLATHIAEERLWEDFLTEHPEYDMDNPGDRRDLDDLKQRLRVGATGRQRPPESLFDEDVIAKELVVGAAQGWDSRIGDGTRSMHEDAELLADLLNHAADPEWVRAGLERLPKSPGSRASASGVDSPLCPTVRISRGGMIGHKYLYPDRIELELAGVSERAQRAALNRSYRSFLQNRMRAEADRASTVKYIRDHAKSTATVYEQKKHIPQSHVDAADHSVFKQTGDFSHVEVDETVDLEALGKVEDEYRALRAWLPVTTAPVLRFRKTGRHNAKGIYHPHVDNIAVDPRHPSGFIHELTHHFDFTTGARPLSQDLPWIRDVSNRLSADEQIQASGKAEYFRTPTEILARSGELYLRWKGVETSLNHSAEDHQAPEYTTLEASKTDIIAFWDAFYQDHGGAIPGTN